MSVEVEGRGDVSLEDREQVGDQRLTARHPLEVVAAAVVVRAVQLRAREARREPSHQRLVPYVHPQRHLRLAAVAAEVPLGDQQADHDPLVVRVHRARSVPAGAGGLCFTGVKNVKRSAKSELRHLKGARGPNLPVNRGGYPGNLPPGQGIRDTPHLPAQRS